MMENKVFFNSAGLKLEGMFFHGGAWGAVVCHPHPLYGGSMDNNVVYAAVRGLQSSGWTTLRFNFRGVGGSQGKSGDGSNEVEDVIGALGFLQDEGGVAPERTVLVGYSFGAWVGLRALVRQGSIYGWVAIAPPVRIWDFSFAKGIAGRKLILGGDNDEFCPVEALMDLVDGLPEPKAYRLLEGADHFFWGYESTLSHIVGVVAGEWAAVGVGP